MSLFVSNDGANSNRLHSPGLWKGCPIEAIKGGVVDGVYFFDDFIDAQPTGTITTAANIGKYSWFAESGGTITPSKTRASGGAIGGIDMNSGTSGDADSVVTTGGLAGGGAPFVISSTAGVVGKLWFEARISISAITDDANQQFIGFTEEARAAAAGVFSGTGGTTADSAFSDIDLIGFARFDGDTSGLRFVYNKNGGTATSLFSAATLVASTYVKVGFVYDPDAPAAKRIKVYVNGVEQSTYVTATLLAVTADFPLGEELALTASVAPDASTSATMGVDWWAACQLG